MLVLSLSPEEALGYLARIHSILVINTTPSELVINYRDKVLIHSLGFPDEPNLKEGCHQILEEFGFHPDTFPAFAIQGWVTICEVIKYDFERFNLDRSAHGHYEDLALYKAKLGINSDVWGIRFEETYIIEEPILDVLPPINIIHTENSGFFWKI